jgi:hypothetical protein
MILYNGFMFPFRELELKMKSKYFFIVAAFLSFLLSVGLWFLTGNESQAIFVGIWVPSILSFGRYFSNG